MICTIKITDKPQTMPYKITITYSHNQHKYRADLLTIWFTVRIFSRRFDFYDKALTVSGNIWTVRRMIRIWRGWFGEIPVCDKTKEVILA